LVIKKLINNVSHRKKEADNKYPSKFLSTAVIIAANNPNKADSDHKDIAAIFREMPALINL
jgi:hypothetical protein